MKKNLKFVSAAAAALLTVAPVVASTTAPVFAADGSANGNSQQQGTTTNPGVKDPNNINISGKATVQAGKPDLSKPATDQYNFTYAEGGAADGFKIIAGPTVIGIYTMQNGKPTTTQATTLKAGSTYVETVSATIVTPKARTAYTINGESGKTSSDSAVITNVHFNILVTATDANNSSQPYFVNKANNYNVNDGALLDGTAKAANNTKQALANAKDMVNLMINGNNINGSITTTKDDVKNQLINQGIQVDANGNYTARTGYYVTLTGVNPMNPKYNASVRIYFSANDTKDAPVWGLFYNDGSTYWMTENKGSFANPISVKYGSNFDPMAPIQNAAIKAMTTHASQTYLDVKVVSNPVDTKKPGYQTVTLQATNPMGVTSTFSYQIVVMPEKPGEGMDQTVHYVPGYGVNEWAIYGNQVSFANKRVQDGQTVTAFDTKTIDGVSYTRIGAKDANTWIQTQYLDGSWNQNSNSSSNSSAQAGKEEAMSGVIVVKYNGLGGVNLLNNKGQYQDQYVKNGSAFKVFGKMTLNGKTYYRLGTQNQWIPAQYAVIR